MEQPTLISRDGLIRIRLSSAKTRPYAMPLPSATRSGISAGERPLSQSPSAPDADKTADVVQVSKIFALPSEIRNAIYMLVNHDHPGDKAGMATNRLFHQSGFKLPQVSRQFRLESYPIFFGCNIFRFWLVQSPPSWLDIMEPKYIAHIKHIRIGDYQNSKVHPHSCTSTIEIDLGGQLPEVRLIPYAKCGWCSRKRNGEGNKLLGVVKSMRDEVSGEMKVTKKKLLEIFEAVGFA